MIAKKGVSDVITTVLIILLALAAVVIVWGVIRPMITDTGTSVAGQTACLTVDVAPLPCDSATITSDDVKIINKGGEALTVVGIVVKADGSTATKEGTLSAYGTATIDFTGTYDIVAGNQVKAAAKITKDGVTTTCPVSATIETCSVA